MDGTYSDLETLLKKYDTTQETTNLARIARIIFGPCTDVLRTVLKNEISPSDLQKKVKVHITYKKKPSISPPQRQLIDGGDYSKFDISLLYLLLRNVCTITEHMNKWGNDPNPGDRCLSANIERIRIIRNEYGHCSEFSISDSEFEKKWKDIFQIVKELEDGFGTSTEYQDVIKELKTCCIDQEGDLYYIKKLQNDVTVLKGKLHFELK